MNNGKPLILIVEDNEDTARIVGRMLQRRGYESLTAFNAAQARALARENAPNLFILDVELPDDDGYCLCREIRQKSDVPVIFLTGRKNPGDAITGLSKGGDYFMTKPFHMEELFAIVKRLLQKEAETREKLHKAVREATELTRGPLTLYIPSGRALVNGSDTKLTPKEFAILLTLAQNEGKALTADELYKMVWNEPIAGNTGALRAHIANIKNKIGVESLDDIDIVFMRGKGYMLVIP